jgi:hypothetical protein
LPIRQQGLSSLPVVRTLMGTDSNQSSDVVETGRARHRKDAA